MTTNRRFALVITVASSVIALVAVALAGPNAPSIPIGPPWGLKFPGIAEVGVYSKDGAALGTLCKAPSSPKVRAAPIKSLAFERTASNDKSIYKLVQEQAAKLNPMDVTIRFKPAATCTLELKGVVFSRYSIGGAANEKVAMERFTLAFAQAKPAK